MALTRSHSITIKENLERSPGFRRELLREAVNAMLDGEVDVGKAVLREYVNGTIGFPRLAKEMQRSSKSLMRMLGPDGNPQAKNLFEIVAILQRNEGVRLELRAVKIAA
ncbi:MAG: transcriptional regulator [Acidobacteriota bacterium]|nr:transcriptional regulator [Acidobacteriota bacterium]